MNAVAPPGLKAGARRSSSPRADDENIRLTIDFDDAEAVASAAHADAARGRNGASSGDNKAGRPADTGPYVPAQLASIEVTLSVEVGNRLVPLRELLTVEPGQLFALDRMTHEPVTILVNGKPFAHGEVVAMGERFGVRLLDILPGGNG